VLLNAGQADFDRRLAAQGLSTAERTAATATLNAALRAESVAGHDLALVQDAALLATYHQAYATGVATALVAAAVVCLLLALLAWVALEERKIEPGGAEVAPEDVALAEPI
jgi:hypothetical protein